MLLEVGKRFGGPGFQIGVIAVPCILLEQRNGLLVRLLLHDHSQYRNRGGAMLSAATGSQLEHARCGRV